MTVPMETAWATSGGAAGAGIFDGAGGVVPGAAGVVEDVFRSSTLTMCRPAAADLAMAPERVRPASEGIRTAAEVDVSRGALRRMLTRGLATLPAFGLGV